ncbi:MAG TPA: hypothetical protein VIT65_23155 [Microlunatus sp.]
MNRLQRVWHFTVLLSLVLVGIAGLALIWLSGLLGALLVLFLSGS